MENFIFCAVKLDKKQEKSHFFNLKYFENSGI